MSLLKQTMPNEPDITISDQHITVPPKKGAPSRKELYSEVAIHARDAIDVLVWSMHHARQESVRISAANNILDRCLPALKGVEIGTEDGNSIKFALLAGLGFLPPNATVGTASVDGDAGQPPQIQGADMAPQGTENDDSPVRTDPPSTP